MVWCGGMGETAEARQAYGRSGMLLRAGWLGMTDWMDAIDVI